MAAAAEAVTDTHDYFASLRRAISPGPTLRDASVWNAMDRIERSMLLAVAGYSKFGRFNGLGQSDIQIYRASDWFDLPETVRTRVKRAAHRLTDRLGRFEGCKP